MKLNKYFKHWLPFVVMFIVMSISCAKDKFDLKKLSGDVLWNPDLAVPVAFGKLTMKDVLTEKQDTVLYINRTDVDQAGVLYDKSDEQIIKIVYSIDSVFNFKEYLKLPTIDPYSFQIKLKPLLINDFNCISANTFGDLLTDNFSLADQNYYTAKIATGVNENYSENQALSTSVHTLPSHASVDWAIFSDGTIEVTAFNEFAVPVQFSYDLYTDYKNNRTLVAKFDFTKDTVTALPFWLQPGKKELRRVKLSNVLVSSKLDYELTNLVYGAANGVLLKSQDSLKFDMIIKDVEAVKGKANLPFQILSVDTTHFFTVHEHNKDKQLYNIDVKQGAVDYSVSTNINSGVSVSLSLPTTQKDGLPASKTIELLSNTSASGKFDLTGYAMDLTKNPAVHYNSLPANLKFAISSDGTNNFIDFDTSKVVSFSFSNSDSLTFSYMGGFYNFDTILIDYDSVAFGLDEILDDYFEGEIVFTEPEIKLVYDNAMGIEGIIDLDITAYDSDMNSKKLFDSGDNIFHINAPANKNDVIPKVNEIVIDKKTSNIVDMFSFLPNSLHYSGQILLNRKYENNTITYLDTTGISANPRDINFVTDHEAANLKIEAGLPLIFYMKNLILRQDFEIGILKDVKEIERLRVYFNTKNGFPIDVKVTVKMLDTTLAPEIQELGVLDMYVVKAALADSRGKVAKGVTMEHTEEKILTREEGNLDLDKFTQMNKLRVEITLNTDKAQDEIPISIYTYYGIEFKMAVDAKFSYLFNIKKNKE
ncbi:MAG: hypothetical protein IPO21_09480 [Bacteroidales bacterium]|nr:hypothetical protein [Bacteroidales bacterium]